MFESRALFPADRAVDVEKWPLLELTDVSVIAFRRGQHDELVDLFQVVEDGPFRVKGTLGPVPKKYRKAGNSITFFIFCFFVFLFCFCFLFLPFIPFCLLPFYLFLTPSFTFPHFYFLPHISHCSPWVD